ncbi:uncharacterized protein LOC143293701 [Babylonia areolata]|uniref:uncharacterized protein LOC143293701 n=1 Tax=Babylonia areolata TaxID=304850 RepID=UPI003FCF6F4E
MNKAVRDKVRPWTQGPMARRRRDKVSIVLPAMDTYRQQMEQVQKLYERLHLKEPRLPLTCRSPLTQGSHSLTALRRLGVTRSYTFAADSDPTYTLPASPIRSSGELTNGYGHSHEPHRPELTLTMPSVEMFKGRGGGGGQRYDTLQQEPIIMVSNHQEQDQTDSGAVPPLVTPHPSRPLAYSYPLTSDQSENVKYVGRKCGWVNPPSTARRNEAPKRKAEDEASSSGVSSDEDCAVVNRAKDWASPTHPHHNDQKGEQQQQQQQQQPRRDSVDILQLCEHLKTHGLGEPILSTHSHTGRQPTSLPPGVRARCLPRDPSTREKIKGRARLDYELANLRAVAFCEQQHPRVFRTASADLRDRDIRLLEEEERENVYRNLNNPRGDADDQNGDVEGADDDDSSLVGSPLSREELFLRIEAWADDVDKALHRGHS